MRKWIGVLLGLTLSVSIISAGEEIATVPTLGEKSSEQGIVSIEEDELEQKEELTVTKLMEYFSDEEIGELYKLGILKGEEVLISKDQVARILCHKLQQSPVYLPATENVASPFIGRLLIEGIWEDYTQIEDAPISTTEWEGLWRKIVLYKESGNNGEKILTTLPKEKQEQYKTYKKQLSSLPSFKAISLGEIAKSKSTLNFKEKQYDMYQYLGTNYVRLVSLEEMGFQKQISGESVYLNYEGAKVPSKEQIALKETKIYISNQKIYIGSLKTQAIIVAGETFIPLRALEVYFSLEAVGEGLVLNEKDTSLYGLLSVEEGKRVNRTEEVLKVSAVNLYWDGKMIVEKPQEERVVPGGNLLEAESLYVLEGYRYLTTLITEIQTENTVLTDSRRYGQDSKALLAAYEKASLTAQEKEKQEEAVKKELFPASPIIATMKYDAAGLKKAEKVEVYSQEGSYYTVISSSGSKTKVPSGSIKIPVDPIASKSPVTKEQIETFINMQNKSSSTEYFIWTDLYRQNTYVFKGQINEWQLMKILISSTGKNATPTPRGTFKLTYRVPYFGIEKGYRCKNAFGFIGTTYLYHSILFDVSGSRIISGKKELGQRASQGCIRLLPEDSLWLYETMKVGTTVWIN